jgi:hypothetical protein
LDQEAGDSTAGKEKARRREMRNADAGLSMQIQNKPSIVLDRRLEKKRPGAVMRN